MVTVLLHGLGADRRQPLELFGPIVEPASETASREPSGVVVAPDVRAHGASPLVGEPAQFALDSLAAEVAASVLTELASVARTERLGGTEQLGDTEQLSPVTLIGISMGAAIALRIAILDLLPVRRAVFVRPAFTDAPLPANLRAFPVIAELLTKLGPVEGAATFRESSLYHQTAAESPLGGRGLLSQFSAPDAAARAIRLAEIPRNRAYRDASSLSALAARGVPSLVVAAPRDPVHPETVAAEWAAGLGSALQRVPARDDGQPAQTDALRAVVSKWLASTA